MVKRTTKLKVPPPSRCPFCTSVSTKLVTHSQLTYVWCRNCNAQGPRFSSLNGGMNKAVEGWNGSFIPQPKPQLKQEIVE